MRWGVLARIMSRMLAVATAAQAVSLVIALVLRERIWYAYAISMGLSGLLGSGLARLPAALRAPGDSLRRREGFVAVVMSWLVLVFFAALTFHLTGYFETFAGCFFEAMSGYTTSGGTVIRDLAIIPDSLLFARALAHWIGGMGIIVLSVAILPELAVGGMQLFSAESSGLDADKLAPRIGATARRLWSVYVFITALEIGLLMLGGMSFFESTLHAFATVATGGFSSRNASIGAYHSLYIEIVVIVFMFISGISFVAQYRAFFQRQPGALFKSPEVRLYSIIMVAAVLLVSLNIYGAGVYDNLGDALRYGSFQVVSIFSTTGFVTADFDKWPEFSRLLMVMLMIIGGCAGSTAGGIKVVRLHIVLKHAIMQLHRLIRPRLVEQLTLEGREVSRETTEGVMGFYLLYFGVLAVSALCLTALGMDVISGTSATIASLNSVGPGLGTVGAVRNFADVPPLGMYVLSATMLLGRLEVYTILVLFSAHFWRRG